MKHATYQSTTYLECDSAIQAAICNPDVDPFVKTMFEMGMIPPEAVGGADQIESLEWSDVLPIARSFVAPMVATIFEEKHGAPIEHRVDDEVISLEFVSSTRSNLRLVAERDEVCGTLKLSINLKQDRLN